MKKSIVTILSIIVCFLPRSILAFHLAEDVSGCILLQVERNGEAWYVYPLDHKRYYLGRPTDAFDLMRERVLGIKNNDLEKMDFTEFGQTKAYEWISRDNFFNAKRFGFIPSYPRGATNIRPASEPWEYVWVGLDNLK